LPTEVRLATIDDAAEIQAIYEPIVLETAVSFELVPPTVEEFQERITRTLEKTPWLMCEVDGAVAGCTFTQGSIGPGKRAKGQWKSRCA
tara:strand:+ start:216 stop:482 length:267 start_codon:yes stop_codon:yes gene_type:complete